MPDVIQIPFVISYLVLSDLVAPTPNVEEASNESSKILEQLQMRREAIEAEVSRLQVRKFVTIFVS